MRVNDRIQSKIYLNSEQFLPVLNDWKSAGYTIVFTNGCFDLVHRGHIDSLCKASEYGDKLIVGLNSDASVRALKGENRPLIDQQSRAMLLASLLMVDAVVLFEEETPFELIKAIMPNVLVKGNEYQVHEIAGADVVLEAGGQVERIGLTPGFSTSDIVRKIKGTD